MPEPTINSVPAHNGYDSTHIQSEAAPEDKQEDHSNGNYSNDQDGDSAMNWGNGNAQGPPNNRYDDGPSESHGIGIKEDG